MCFIFLTTDGKNFKKFNHFHRSPQGHEGYPAPLILLLLPASPHSIIVLNFRFRRRVAGAVAEA